MISRFKRRFLLRFQTGFAVFLLLYFLAYCLGFGRLVNPTTSKIFGKVATLGVSLHANHTKAVKTWGNGGDTTGEHNMFSDQTGPLDTDSSSKNKGGTKIDGEQQVVIIYDDETDIIDPEIKREAYVRAILDPEDTSTPRLSCPRLNAERYDYLKVPDGERRLMYFFALDLREVVDLLPRLLGSVVESMRFLGPQNSVLSVVEGNSDDGTREVLSVLKPELEALGITYILRSSDINPIGSDDRIGNLAKLRSQALEPLRKDWSATARLLGLPVLELGFMEDATVVFLNDVAACTDDILELLHQRAFQEADMTCAMDWYYPGERDQLSFFYDVWISRSLSGNLFFDIPVEDGSWDNAEHLLPYDADAESRARLAAHRPFQVFSCWNGAAAFTAKPLLDGKVGFRRDMWFHGYGRIAVVPSVNLEYSNEKGRWIKAERGYASDWTAREGGEAGEEGEGEDDMPPMKIEWRGPPRRVKCVPEFTRQFWVPWNESLGL
ncbi:Alpha-1,3-mannosyltransferase CMT1 [Cytospora mali]|uniref:Alpha-1,3-mannosyltransferase CMT1 n=1 Tax=Cytospora mali TaxID=578113 RepID=A0A194VWK8_CYTMA|nr:Alpha-1,3-mannosyltransferase CMT1 [Valsa mali]